MKITWKTVFLLGHAVGDSILNEYLEAEGKIHRDLIRGAQKEHYHNLTLKTQTGLEWASKYCDFEFLLKADDDVFVNPYNRLDYLGKPELYGKVSGTRLEPFSGREVWSIFGGLQQNYISCLLQWTSISVIIRLGPQVSGNV